MSHLITWRNPNGQETNWIAAEQQRFFNPSLKKIFGTFVGLGCIIPIATIESVAYTAFAALSYPIKPLSDRPYTFFVKLLESSSFTVIWSLVDQVFYNPFFLDLMTDESFARLWAHHFNPTRIEILRFEDRARIVNWVEQHNPPHQAAPLLAPIIDLGYRLRDSNRLGAKFLYEEVFKKESPEVMETARDYDPAVIPYILSKAILIYAGGAKSKEAIPVFFKDDTRAKIQSFRRTIAPEVVRRLEAKLMTLDLFNAPTDADLQEAFNTLRNIAYGEAQGGFFATRCWQDAIALLNAPNNNRA